MSAMHGFHGVPERDYGSLAEDLSVWDDLDSYSPDLRVQGLEIIVMAGGGEISLSMLTKEQLNNPTMMELILTCGVDHPEISRTVDRMKWNQGESIEF